MKPNEFPGAFPHQHGDPRGLVERIQAQLRERIQEALDMAAIKLLVDLRQRHGAPAPDASSDADRRESERIAADLLTHVRNAFRAELESDERQQLERAEAGAEGPRESFLAGQVFLACRLPDYWQRLEAHEIAYASARLKTPPSRESWIGRLFGR